MSEKQFMNYYRCPYDGTEWADVWSCCCNDMCPKCHTKDIEPYRSVNIVHSKGSSSERRRDVVAKSREGARQGRN